MSLEIFRITENGAGWVDFSEATASEKLDLELAILTNAPVQILCHVCHVQIEKGNACPKHTNLNTCKVCLMPHEGIYCDNCFTGERVNVSAPNKFNKWSRVMKLTPVNA